MGIFQGNMPDLDGISAKRGEFGPEPDRLWRPTTGPAPSHSSARALSTTLLTAHSPMPMASSTPARM